MIRTDLAMELLPEEKTDSLSGVNVHRENKYGIESLVVEIKSNRASEALGKPRGKYITIDVEEVLQRKKDSFENAVGTISGYILEMLNFGDKLPVLVAGLGNRAITPDSLGPLTADHILVTRHMVRSMPKEFDAFRPVSAFSPGVLGTTGLESAESVLAMVDKTRAAAVIVVDAIAARDTGRLCSTVQITDTGICPGSGIGNLRMALNTETLGVPVIGVGVPTVTDASTLALDLLEKHHVSFDEKEIMKENSPMIVTSSDIDKQVREISRILSFGLNLALQPNLSMKDLEDLCY